jgi:hypothetical protein
MFNFLPLVGCQSRASTADGDDDFFFHAPGLRLICFTRLFGFISTLVELNDALLSLSTSFTSEWESTL